MCRPTQQVDVAVLAAAAAAGLRPSAKGAFYLLLRVEGVAGATRHRWEAPLVCRVEVVLQLFHLMWVQQRTVEVGVGIKPRAVHMEDEVQATPALKPLLEDRGGLSVLVGVVGQVAYVLVQPLSSAAQVGQLAALLGVR